MMDIILGTSISGGVALITFLYKKTPTILYKIHRKFLSRKIKKLFREENFDNIGNEIDKLEKLLNKYKVIRKKKMKKEVYSKEEIDNRLNMILRTSTGLSRKELCDISINEN